jgi:hypothetical protein
MTFSRMTEDTSPQQVKLNRSRAAGSGRTTEPAYYLPNAKGGLSFIPRRGVELGAYVTTRDALMRFAADTPLRLLSILPDIHPAFGLALWNALRLSCNPADLKIVAVQPGADPDSDEEDDAGTAAINLLWENLPPEIGGLNGLQTTGMICALLTGLPFFEAVPGARGRGLWRVYPVDSLTLRFNREGPDDDVIAYQLQRYPSSATKTGGYVPLDPNRMFWHPIDTFPDDPYGRAPYAPALAECLRDLALMQDLTDAVHNAAWPRLAIPFNFKEMFEVAKLYGMDGIEAEQWVQEQFDDLVAKINAMNPSDNLHYDASGDVVVIEGSKGFSALEPILVYLRQRIVQSLKALPTLMGLNDGSTETFSSIEWSIYASGLESIRSVVFKLLERIASLHLRLMGKPLVAKAKYQQLRTVDALMEANTEAVRIKNAITKRQQGWQTNDTSSQEITGTDAVADPEPVAPTFGTQPNQTTDQTEIENKPKGAGNTQEDKDANKPQKQQP